MKHKSQNNSKEKELETQNEPIVNSEENTDNKAQDKEDKVEKEAESQKKEIDREAELEKKIAEEKDKFLRLFAEFENYKKRTSRERLELFKTANEEVMVALLPVLDDFERAINEIAKLENNEYLKGVELISVKLSDILSSKGLSKVELNKGDNFDVDKAEAITQIVAGEDMSGKIVDIIEAGYKLGNKIIRFPKVVIGQ